MVKESQHVEFGETHVFVGPRFVVSVRHGSLQSHVGLRARCEASKHLLAKGPGFVLYALMDFVVDQYFPILEALEEKVVELEEVVLDEKFIHETTSRIYHLKRELLSIKRAVSPLVDICSRLMRFDLDLLPEETKPYFRDVYDHAMRINEMADTLREVLATALDANLSVISVSQNKDTKRLAAWAAIIAAPTAIAGIYGMNFEYMPELGWRYGYFVASGQSPRCAAGCGWGSSGRVGYRKKAKHHWTTFSKKNPSGITRTKRNGKLLSCVGIPAGRLGGHKALFFFLQELQSLENRLAKACPCFERLSRVGDVRRCGDGLGRDRPRG